MNNTRKNQTLLIVEGHLEKNFFIDVLMKCIPQIGISASDIQIFESDIYDLYDDIVKEYSDDWMNQDINLPLLISRTKNIEPPLNPNIFTNIILIFDYERHDPSFDFKKINQLKEHFNNPTEDGLLYINYPMVESLFDMEQIPSSNYLTHKINASFKAGKVYKKSVIAKSALYKLIKLHDIFYKRCKRLSDIQKNIILEYIVNIDNSENLINNTYEFVRELADDGTANFIANSMGALIQSNGYLTKYNKSYISVLKDYILYVARANIIKAWQIQTGEDYMTDQDLFDVYSHLDLYKVLLIQNELCKDWDNCYLWVLNESITFLAEYKFFWNTDMQ